MPTKNTISDFIRKARAVHGNRYDYSQVEYINNKTPVKIICKNMVHSYRDQTDIFTVDVLNVE